MFLYIESFSILNSANSSYLTDNVKSPGLLLLGRARKLPSTPRVSRRFSASTPVMLGWNHLWTETQNIIRGKRVISQNNMTATKKALKSFLHTKNTQRNQLLHQNLNMSLTVEMAICIQKQCSLNLLTLLLSDAFNPLIKSPYHSKY